MTEPEADEALEREGVCEKCGAPIVIYAEGTGLLPDEFCGERHAAHHWRACELHQKIAKLEADLQLERSRCY